MSTSEDDEAFGSDPFGLRDLWRRNRGCPNNNPATAASTSAASGAPFALASNSPSVAASGAPGDVAPSPLVALAASAIASVAASTAGVIDEALGFLIVAVTMHTAATTVSFGCLEDGLAWRSEQLGW